MQSKAATVAAYLAELPAERRAVLDAVRAVILKNLDAKYEEGMQYGMVGYYVPHAVFPPGYHCDPKQPLPFAGLAAQKNYFAVYLMSLYGSGTQEAWFRKEWAKSGKKLDMGKCCVRFKTLDDLPLAVIGEAIRRTPAHVYVAHYQSALEAMKAAGPRKRPDATPALTKKGAAATRAAKATKSSASKKAAQATPAKKRKAGKSA